MRPETVLYAACGTATLLLAAYIGLELDRPATGKGGRRFRKKATGSGPCMGGLVNQGVTCYMNCVLQALASSERLLTWLASSAGEAASQAQPLSPQRPITQSLLSLLRCLNQRSTSPHSYTTEELAANLARVYSRQGSTASLQARFMQQDAQEFLQLLTTAIADEAQAGTKASLSAVLHPGDQVEGTLGKDGGSPLSLSTPHTPLRGTQSSVLVCRACFRATPVRLQSFDCLSLALVPSAPSGACTLQDCILHAAQEETIDGVLCEHCSRDKELADLLAPAATETDCDAPTAPKHTLSDAEERRVFELLTCYTWADARRMLAPLCDEQRERILSQLQQRHQSAHYNYTPVTPVRQQCTKSMRISSYPPLLAIHINRVSVGALGFNKDDAHLVFPEVLRFQTSSLIRYRLISMVVHVGSGHTEGHFVTIRRVEDEQKDEKREENGNKAKAVEENKAEEKQEEEEREDDELTSIPLEGLQVPRASRWIWASDEHVVEVPLTRALTANPYLMFYERID